MIRHPLTIALQQHDYARVLAWAHALGITPGLGALEGNAVVRTPADEIRSTDPAKTDTSGDAA